MKLTDAFSPLRGDVVAFIGAGGKTSALVGLGYELAEAGWRVLATTTTNMTEEQVALFPRAMSSNSDATAISQALNEDNFVLLHKEIRQGRVYGPALGWTPELLDSVDSDILLVEADDAAGRPFKAPRNDEPRIPLETTVVVSVASLSALGLPLDSEHIYNPGAMVDRFGFVENSPVKSPWLAQVLRDETLGLRGVPENARVIVFLNRTPERGYVRGRARLIARLTLQSERISAVALGSVRGAEPVSELQRPVGALVLAGCQQDDCSKGAMPPKAGQQGRSVAQIAEQLMRSRIDHIRIVTGAGAKETRAAVKHLRLRTAHNRAFRTGGIISSLKTGLRALPKNIAAFILVPADVAAIPAKLFYQIMSTHARGDGKFIVPRFGDCCGSPVLISRPYLSEIVKMPKATDWSTIVERFAADITFLHVDAACNSTAAPTVTENDWLRLDGSIQTRSR